jgi:hypothetical protein
VTAAHNAALRLKPVAFSLQATPDAKGTIAVHDGKQQYILYVIGGTGKLTLNDSKGETIGDITYKPDDIIVF